MDHSSDSRRRRRAGALMLLSLLTVVSLGSSVLSIAAFTDQASVSAGFDTGTIVLDGTKINGLVLTTTAMMPGDSVTDDVVIENDGSAQLRYAMTSSSTDADGKGLRADLTLTIKTIDVTTPASPCNDFDGSTTLYNAAIGAAAASFGDPTTGAHTGDRVLSAGANETLCFRVRLPAGTGNTSQGASTTTTFTFDAEQTSSNP